MMMTHRGDTPAVVGGELLRISDLEIDSERGMSEEHSVLKPE